ncbi:MAG: hypothetical protein RQ826_04480 [Xanthomonadales bacterium]|nr:hypothetical protein [Xanthomonadales bacterium]
MKTLIIFLTAFFMLLPVMAMADEHEEKTIKVQTWDFSDPFLVAEKGDPCAEFLSYLMGSYEKYKMLGMTGIKGPPGVVYTLENQKGDIAILKCGTAGGCSGHDEDEGHDEGTH